MKTIPKIFIEENIKYPFFNENCKLKILSLYLDVIHSNIPEKYFVCKILEEVIKLNKTDDGCIYLFPIYENYFQDIRFSKTVADEPFLTDEGAYIVRRLSIECIRASSNKNDNLFFVWAVLTHIWKLNKHLIDKDY
ncbi:MAG: hypothetical protein J6J00_06455 [Treponema sp.]|nr:hypothetical protein [Treponema sp.]